MPAAKALVYLVPTPEIIKLATRPPKSADPRNAAPNGHIDMTFVKHSLPVAAGHDLDLQVFAQALP